MAPRRLALVACAVLAATTVGCSDRDGSDADRDRPAATTSAAPSTPATTSTTAPDGCATAATCTLRAAGARDDLLIGTALKLGDEKRRALTAQQFSAGSSEIEFLWSVIHPAPDVWEFSGADKVVAFAEAHDLELTATHFVWDPPNIPSVLPDWVRAIDDPDELRATLRDYLTVLHDRYGDRIQRWSIVNEPLDDVGDLETRNHFFQVLGPGYVADAFRMAADVWPSATLIVNDYNTEYLQGKADGMVRLVADLKRQGLRVDGVGIQGHLFLGEPNWPVLASLQDGLAERGIPFAFTEVDAPLVPVTKATRFTPAQQQAWVTRLLRTCLDHRNCTSFGFWGLDDGDTWITGFIGPDTAPLLYDASLRPKPLYDAFRAELLKGRPPR